jgi:hypothetical protein
MPNRLIGEIAGAHGFSSDATLTRRAEPDVRPNVAEAARRSWTSFQPV